MKKSTIGSMKAKESAADVFASASRPRTFFAVARSLMPGINLLAQHPDACGRSLPLLCAHALECLLKSFLSTVVDVDKLEKQQHIRHNLSILWSMAVEHGLERPEQPPPWVERLSEVHKHPYHLRYQKGVHGVVMPGIQPMVAELNALLEVVGNQT